MRLSCDRFVIMPCFLVEPIGIKYKDGSKPCFMCRDAGDAGDAVFWMTWDDHEQPHADVSRAPGLSSIAILVAYLNKICVFRVESCKKMEFE